MSVNCPMCRGAGTIPGGVPASAKPPVRGSASDEPRDQPDHQGDRQHDHEQDQAHDDQPLGALGHPDQGVHDRSVGPTAGGRPDIDAIRARVEAAAEGPWQWEADSCSDDGLMYHPGRVWAEGGVDYFGEANDDYVLATHLGNADAEFIAHARTDIPLLLAEVDRLREALSLSEGERGALDTGAGTLLGENVELRAALDEARTERDELRARLLDREREHADRLAAEATEGDTGICRTCAEPITFTTVEEPGYLPRTGWSDGAHRDALVCFRALGYRHVPLVGRERGIWDAATKAAGAES